jgi:uncharacterized protein YbaR (Trm112 family)
MKILCCKYCRTPLVYRRQRALFSCMCDEEFRSISIEKVDAGHDNVIYLSKEELEDNSGSFIKTP